ncbi:hypothetical protein OF376_00460 [Ureaplasma miroungigenitalium]|uniref:Lipoprotein n=1 Tax=Ureaplasma miroungigenitalium TaxID=1042321 RepID=A0ABT3BML0_9BACT|nr:hypothetical protein [Ureaplasma miroungigenitalium]MCV3728262.1 hypothetical protein [Ureaplasma miroungigenitalium]
MKKNKRVLAFGLVGLIGASAMASVLVACKPETNISLFDFNKLCVEYTTKYVNHKYSEKINQIIEHHKALVEQINETNEKTKALKIQAAMKAMEEEIQQYVAHQTIIDEENAKVINFTPAKTTIKMSYKNADQIVFDTFNDFVINDVIVELADESFNYTIKKVVKTPDGLKVIYHLEKNQQVSEDFNYLISKDGFKSTEVEQIDFQALNQQVVISYHDASNTLFADAITEKEALDTVVPPGVLLHIQNINKDDQNYIVVYQLEKNGQKSSDLTIKISSSVFKQVSEDEPEPYNPKPMEWDKFNQNTTVKFVNQDNVYFEDVPEVITENDIIFEYSNPEINDFKFISAAKEGSEIIVKYTITYDKQTSKILEKSILQRHFKQHKPKEYEDLTQKYTALQTQLDTLEDETFKNSLKTNLTNVYQIAENEVTNSQTSKLAIKRLSSHIAITEQLLLINKKMAELKAKPQTNDQEIAAAKALAQEIAQLFANNKNNISLETLDSGYATMINELYAKFIEARPVETFHTIGGLMTTDKTLKLGQVDSDVNLNSVLTYKIVDNDHVDIFISNVQFDNGKYTQEKYAEKLVEIIADFQLIQLTEHNTFSYEPDTASKDYIKSDEELQNPANGLRYKPANLSFFDEQICHTSIKESTDIQNIINELQTNKQLVFKNVYIPNIANTLKSNERLCFVMSDFNMLKQDPKGSEELVSLFETGYSNNGVEFLGHDTIVAMSKAKSYLHERPSVVVFETKQKQEN